MPISQVFESKDAAPEFIRDHLVEREGKFVFEAELPTETKGLKSALEKERQLRAERDKALGRYADIDPDDYRRLKEQEAAIRDKKLLDEGKVEELLTERITRAKADWEKKDADAQRTIASQQEQLSRLLIDNEIVRLLESSSSKLRAAPGALDDILIQARHGARPIRLGKDGTPVPMDGDKPFYGKNPEKPAGLDEWLGDLATRKPHLFVAPSGAGAHNNHGGTPPSKQFKDWTREEKDAFIREHGPAAYEQKVLEARRALRAA